MLRQIKRLFHQYREYVRVDLLMYGVLIIMIIVYFIISTLTN
jgi:hypothetical protein